MAELKREKRSEWAVSQLYDRIVYSGEYPQGSKLPNENELSQQLHVSRTTLREAVSCLVAQGMLEIRRGKGTFVTECLPQSAMDFSNFQKLRTRVRVKDLFEMRLIFEPATAALACERATDAELERIRSMACRVERSAKEGGNWSAEDQAMHLAITKASHNEYMRDLYHIINTAVEEILEISPSRKQLEDIALADNKTLLYFLSRRDGEGARMAMSIHIKHIMDTMQM